MAHAKLAFGALLLLAASLGHAAGADIDLRQAARLHKGGDTPAAVAIWRQWARQGNADAAYNLAVIHQHGDGVAYNAAEALRWYRVAADLGDKPAQFQLGLMYQNGEGVAADANQAHEWFTRHRREHVHHEHDARMAAWRQQAQALIEERDRREAAALARRDGERVMAELRRRAGMGGGNAATAVIAAAPAPLSAR